MPVYAGVSPDGEDWYIETSSTIGLQAPMKSVNKERLVAAAFFLGRALCEGSKDGFAWISFCRWTPDQQYGMEQHVNETYQLAFTPFGTVVLKNWQQIYIPISDKQPHRPVLIYEYDAYCFLFCDASHFMPFRQAWTVFAGVFGVEPAPIAEPAPEGRFEDIRQYMDQHAHESDDGEPIRPRFHNLDLKTESL
jgi:hypothetical protein